MCFFFSFIPATVWLVIGYFVLFASTRADGALRKFGQVLAIWSFVVAAFFPIGGTYVTLADLCPVEALMETTHSETP